MFGTYKLAVPGRLWNPYNGRMTEKGDAAGRFRKVLQQELRRPAFLTDEDLRGEWQASLPQFARSLPAPYPIFTPNEQKILTWGYPVKSSGGLRRLHHQLERQLGRELEFRLLRQPDSDDRRKVMLGRDRWVLSLEKVLQNTILNDYGRGLVEVFLLLLSADIQRTLAKLPRVMQNKTGDRVQGEEFRIQLATILGGLLSRAAFAAAEHIRQLVDAPSNVDTSPVLKLIREDPVLLVDARPSSAPGRLPALMPSTSHGDVTMLLQLAETVARKLRVVLRDRPDFRGVVRHVCGRTFDPGSAFAALEPRLLDLLRSSGFARTFGLEVAQIGLLRSLGLRLKAIELVAALRQRVVMMEAVSGAGWAIRLKGERVEIAASTRPFDFTAHGVIDSAVHRFGLIYDLTDFTAVLEEVRKAGRQAEEKALEFMYVFQSHTEVIRERRRLSFEKFLGDGAFFSARRAVRTLAAACEIQHAYDQLRQRGFPFDKGLRIAVNSAEYRLLPMRASAAGRVEYEFFGHGIVELARLTTGKSTRELEEVAELLIHAGYDTDAVDDFLAPLIENRGAKTTGAERPYSVTLDSRGELVNEGIVLTLPFVASLEKELGEVTLQEATFDGSRWLILTLDPDGAGPVSVGLRILGMARLKGLPPLELVEAVPWSVDQAELSPIVARQALISKLRELSGPEGARSESEDAGDELVGEDLVVVCFQESSGGYRWIIGQHREADDMVLHALTMNLSVPERKDGQPVELWLFQNRYQLAKKYGALRESASGVAAPMAQLRDQAGFQAWILAAPHKAIWSPE